MCEGTSMYRQDSERGDQLSGTHIMDNFRLFCDIAFFAKIYLAQKLNPYDFIKEIGVVS